MELLSGKVPVVIAGVLTSTAALAFYCPPQFQETFVEPVFTTSKQAISESVQVVDQALSKQLEFNSQRLTSAIAVLTKQKAVAANQISDGNRTAAQATATALQALAQAERVKKARFEYGGEFGQGYQPCKVYTTRNTIANRDAEMAVERRTRIMSEIVAAPGRYANPVQAQQAALTEHRASYCTADQVASGLCEKVGALPGANLSVATLFEPSMENEPLYQAKVSFVNNLVGLPDAPISKEAGKSAAADAYALAKTRKDAIVSPALASLKEIQLDYSGITVAHGNSSDLPMAVHFRNEVKRYLGSGTEYDKWNNTLTAQNSRGLMVELLKQKALDLALSEKQYRQYERMEAQLVGLVSLELQKNRTMDRSAQMQQDAAKRNATTAIK
jgi:hypothetical protein